MNATSTATLDYTVAGPRGAPLLLFLHGWPDDPTMWRHQVAVLKEQYRCVLPTLPNFGASKHEPGGCDFPTIIQRLHETINEVADGPVTLIIHDWGAYIGYLYEKQYPERVKSIVAMDIGGHFQPANLRAAAMFVSYQWTLISLWFVGGLIPPLGTWLTRNFARMLKVPKRQYSSLQVRCNYPYFYFWRANLLPWLRSRLLGAYHPQCRVLFIYGGDKPLMFHSQRWLETVENSGGRNVCIKEGAHWFMEEQVEQVNILLSEWLDPESA